MDWHVSGKRIRKPLNTRNWQVAQMHARKLEVEGVTTKLSPQTVEQACKKFIQDAQSRGLRPRTIYKYRLLFKQLKAFCDLNGMAFVGSLGVEELRTFRASWPNQNLSAQKKLEHLKTFFRFVHESGWIQTNPAQAITSPKVSDPPVLPFSDSEMEKILAACETHRTRQRGQELRALVLVMRHSGLRIGDACTLARDKVQHDILELRTAKSGTKVRIPLHSDAVESLAALPKKGKHYFWSWASSVKTVTSIWHQTFKSLFDRAGVKGHPHQLRHTFAVGLLQKGVSMENLSTLLGHRSIRITEKFYAPWVAGRQQYLEDVVRKTW
jgi:integrase/recombinase XerD